MFQLDTDLVFDSQEHLKHENQQRPKRTLEIENNSSPPVEEHWLTSTVDRIKRSIDSIFSKNTHQEKLGHKQAQKQPHHRSTTSRKHQNKSRAGRNHRQVDDYGEEAEEYDEVSTADNVICLKKSSLSKHINIVWTFGKNPVIGQFLLFKFIEGNIIFF